MRRSVLSALVAGFVLFIAPAAYGALVLTSSRTIDCGGNDFVRAVDADSNGIIYATGDFRRTLEGQGDVWLARYNAALVMTASATFDGSSHVGDYGYDIKVGADGYIYVGGEINNAGNIWLAKYDSGLHLISNVTFSGGAINTCSGIALDRHGNIYVTGKVGGETSCDIWVACFNSSLVLVASTTISNPVQNRSVDEGFGITVDDADNIYVTGAIGGPSSDIWLGKFNSSLSLLSSTRINCEGNTTDKGYRIAYFGGQVYVAGCFYTGNYPHFWAGRFRASDLVLQSSVTIMHAGMSEIAGGIDIDSNGTVFITGRVYDDANRVWFGRYDSSLVIQSSATFGSGSGLALTVKTSEHRNTAWLGGNVTNNNQQDLWMGKYVENLARPTAPAGFTALAVSTDTILFSWDDTSDAENGFRLYDGAGNIIGELPEDTTSWMASGLPPDTASSIREIRAYNELGESGAAVLLSACYTLPASPTRCSVAARTTESLTLQWEGSGASSFRVEISSDNVHWDTSGDNVSGTVFMAESLRRATKYYVRIWGYNHDHLLSAGSARLVTMTEPIVPPEPPSGFRGDPQTVASILFSWRDNSEMEEGFRVYTATGGLLAELGTDATTWIQSGFSQNGESAAWAVRSFNFGGESNGVALSSPCYTLVNAPTGFSALEKSTHSITVQWNANGASAFQVRWSSDSVHWNIADNLAGTNYLCDGLQRATQYFFRVWAYNGGHIISANSTFLMAKTEPVSVPAPPAGFSAVALSTSMIRFSWTASTGTTMDGYHLWTSTGAMVDELAPGITAWLQAGIGPNSQSRAWSLSAFNANGESNLAALSTPCHTLALPPSDAEITFHGQRSLGIRWDGQGGSSFRVDLSSDEFHWTSVQEYLPVSTYTQNSLEPFTTYYFRIWANNGNSIQSVDYEALSGMTVLNGEMAPPSLFEASVLSTGSISYTWHDMSPDEDGFRLYTSSGGVFVELAPNTTGWAQTGMAPDMPAAARDIRSFNGHGESAPILLSSGCYTLANAPYDLLVSSRTPHRIAMQWSNGGASRFQVSRSTDSLHWTVAGEPLSNSFTLDSLRFATTYYIRVFAVNHDGIFAGPATASCVTDPLAAILFDPSQGEHTVTYSFSRNGEQKEISVYVPQGALTGDMYIDINPDAAENPREISGAMIQTANERLAVGGQVILPGTITEFTLYDAMGNRITGPFAQPVTIRIPYSDADHDGLVDGVTPALPAADLQVFVLNEQSGQWESVGGTVDTFACAVSVSVAHFSVYALAGRPVSASVNACAYPNPFYPARHGHITIGAVPSGTRARLFNIAGELVRELTDGIVMGKILWDGRNGSGIPVASGVYIALIDGDGLKKKIKIAVIR